ncbi:MAG: hypothetical protein IJC34_00575 [Lentisphaeria bacterium]|nr:hypothetical protein [Lentisphaeria bacterium]
MVDGKINTADLPPNCPLWPQDPATADKTILNAWRGRKLGAKSIWGLADLAAGAFGAADKEETLAQFNTGGKLSKGAYKGMATYRENVKEWKKKPEESDPPMVPTAMIYRLFMAAQNAAGCADPLLDWLEKQTWFAGVPATIKMHLSDQYAKPAPAAFNENAIFVYKLEEMAGKSTGLKRQKKANKK